MNEEKKNLREPRQKNKLIRFQINSRIILGGTLIAISFISAYIISDTNNRMTTVWSATTDLAPGEIIEAGDVIESLAGTPTPALDVLVKTMEGRKVGDVVEIVVNTLNSNPNETRRTEKVRLIASPDDPQRTIIGIVPADTRTVDVPFEVDISTDSIGGPSAGLAFALALLDELTPGNLMGKVSVAATGTIAEDGTVGAIGALRQKAVAVERSGAGLFLVPKSQTPDEIASARAAVGSKLKIVPVGTLDEALDALVEYGGGKLPASPSGD